MALWFISSPYTHELNSVIKFRTQLKNILFISLSSLSTLCCATLWLTRCRVIKNLFIVISSHQWGIHQSHDNVALYYKILPTACYLYHLLCAGKLSAVFFVAYWKFFFLYLLSEIKTAICAYSRSEAKVWSRSRLQLVILMEVWEMSRCFIKNGMINVRVLR